MVAAEPPPVSAAGFQPADGQFVFLPSHPDQVFILPLNYIYKYGKRASVMLVSVNVDPPSNSPPSVDDLLVKVESDAIIEIDCGRSLMRLTQALEIDAGGRVKRDEIQPNNLRWKPISTYDYPLVAMKKVVCEGFDVSKITHDELRKAIPEIQVGQYSSKPKP